jgi:hypothetical protein
MRWPKTSTLDPTDPSVSISTASWAPGEGGAELVFGLRMAPGQDGPRTSVGFDELNRLSTAHSSWGPR